MKVGKTPYGEKWHIVRKDGIPLCGYVSYNWREAQILDTDSFPENLCHNCKKTLLKKNKAKPRRSR